MSITLPTYTRREAPLLGRRDRVMAIVLTSLRRETRRPAAIFAFGIGFSITTISSLFLSSLTRRKGYAAAGVFAITLGLTIPVGILASAGAVNEPRLLYLSPWEDFLAVARGAYGVSGGPIDWPVALAILLGVTVLAALATYLRMRAVEVVSG